MVDRGYEKLKGIWEERFEAFYGFWRGFVDDVVFAFQDCGDFQQGFARVRCPECRSELLVATSCKRRGFCASCAAKRAAIFGAFLREEVLEEVPHAMWTLTIPKILRRYFLNHRQLLGKLARASFETVQELMAEAVGADESFRIGMVPVIQTSGDLLEWNPHVHALASRGGWLRDGSWVPVPYVDTKAAELLFRSKVIGFLKAEGLLSEQRIEMLQSWHHSGFSAHNSVTVQPEDHDQIERLARYLLHPPVSLERMRIDESSGQVLYDRKRDRGLGKTQTFDPLDFLARMLMHIPEPRLHTTFFYGWYSNATRGRRRKLAEQDSPETEDASSQEDPPNAAERRRLRRLWANMLRRIYEVDPLICVECGSEMKIVSFIMDPPVIKKILEHLAKKKGTRGRAPPRRVLPKSEDHQHSTGARWPHEVSKR